MAAGSMAKATIHEPVGAKDLWHHKGWQLPAYIQHVANDLRESGHDESRAIQIAVGVIKNWAAGHDGKGHRVSATTQAAAAKALAEWEALKARAAASHSLTAAPSSTVDLATSVMATTDSPTLTVPAGTRHYRHGWVRIDAAGPSAVERATRAVTTDGHALLHGAGMVPVAQKVVERAKAAGHRVSVSRVDVRGTPHLHVAKRGTDLTAGPTQTVDLAFTEALHPRGAKGSSSGGKFVAKNSKSSSAKSSSSSGGSLPGNVAANVRDFQRRNHLPVTGVIDTATAAKIRADQAPKGRKGKSAKTKARKAAAAARRAAKAAARAKRQQTAQHVATVNAMTPAQRASARAAVPVPPTGYVWTPTNTLRRYP